MKRISDGVTDFDFLLLNGSPDPISESVDEITRPNVDSHAFRRQGKRGQRYQLFSRTDVDDEPAVKTQLEAYKAFVSKIVTVTDSINNVRDNVIVLGVQMQRQKKILGASGTLISTTAGAMLECIWDLLELDES